MRAVFLHELSGAFTSLSGYVFGAFVLLFAGIYTMLYNIQSAITNFEYVLGSMSFVFLLIVPIATMRVVAEERRQRTDLLLYSLPLSMTQVVLGKYLALLALFAVPLGIVGMYPVLLSSYGNIRLVAAFTALAGFFALGAALLAIGVYVSSVTESQAVAAGLCFVVMLLNYFLADLAAVTSTSSFGSALALAVLTLVAGALVGAMTKNALAGLVTAAALAGAVAAAYLWDSSLFEGLFPWLMEQLSLFECFYGMVNGVFDLTGLVYLASVSGVFLFLSVQSLEKRRWSA